MPDSDRTTRLDLGRERAMTALEKIAAERRRQIDQEGWTAEHDDTHRAGELALAAAAYAAVSSARIDGSMTIADLAFRLWPFQPYQMKQKDQEADLVRAGALIVAELERIERAGSSSGQNFGRGGGSRNGR